MSGSSAGSSPLLLLGLALIVLLAVSAVVFAIARAKRGAPIAVPGAAPAPVPSAPAPIEPLVTPTPAIAAAAVPGPTGEVFISYSSKDKPTADAICALLEQSGVRCWIAPRDILPGQEWAESILHGISHARVFVLVFSAAANTSPQVGREVERAVHNEVPIIPFRVEDVTPNASLEYFISTPHWLDAITPPLEAHVQRLCESIESLLARAAT